MIGGLLCLIQLVPVGGGIGSSGVGLVVVRVERHFGAPGLSLWCGVTHVDMGSSSWFWGGMGNLG